jgi:hypothetical protein
MNINIYISFHEKVFNILKIKCIVIVYDIQNEEKDEK